MAKEIKVYVVGDARYYAAWIRDHKLVNKIEDANVVLFTGGEDVDPSLYNSKKLPKTCSNLDRDLKEKAEFEKIRPDQLALGICRGSQFLCVMNGGKLIQHCENHALFGTHEIQDPNGITRVDITSTHHQMQYPFNLPSRDYEILYCASPQRSGRYEGDFDGGQIWCEPEVVLYHVKGLPKCLAIQGHPEGMRKEAPVVGILNDLITKYVQ